MRSDTDASASVAANWLRGGLTSTIAALPFFGLAGTLCAESVLTCGACDGVRAGAVALAVVTTLSSVSTGENLSPLGELGGEVVIPHDGCQ